MTASYFAGIDVGSSATKAIIIDSDNAVTGSWAARSGVDFSKAARTGLQNACDQGCLDVKRINDIVSTGYGRKNVKAASYYKTEISCHAKGCYHFFSRPLTIIDIGGQDNKMIKVDEKGRRTSFKMNRKCAAGTGAFLEEMAARLDMNLEEMNRLALQARGMVALGSFCTVFSATEVLESIRAGHNPSDIVKGIYYSMVKRVLEMDMLSDDVVMTGGVVAHNSCIVEITKNIIGKNVLIPPLPQFTGAFGAALYAREAWFKNKG